MSAPVYKTGMVLGKDGKIGFTAEFLALRKNTEVHKIDCWWNNAYFLSNNAYNSRNCEHRLCLL